jgi:hypothetical protein
MRALMAWMIGWVGLAGCSFGQGVRIEDVDVELPAGHRLIDWLREAGDEEPGTKSFRIMSEAPDGSLWIYFVEVDPATGRHAPVRSGAHVGHAVVWSPPVALPERQPVVAVRWFTAESRGRDYLAVVTLELHDGIMYFPHFNVHLFRKTGEDFAHLQTIVETNGRFMEIHFADFDGDDLPEICYLYEPANGVILQIWRQGPDGYYERGQLTGSKSVYFQLEFSGIPTVLLSSQHERVTLRWDKEAGEFRAR